MRIAMVAGEASGDLLASHLIHALRTHLPDAEFFGIGGPKMESQGFSSWWPSEALAVNGYVDVLRRFRELSGIRNGLLRRLKDDPPDLFIGVDAPDFNLWLEEKLRDSGIKTIHYVSPSIWAWRAGRVKRIKRSADLVLCLFPFEPEIYARNGVPAAYVGHPLADVFPLVPDRAAMREHLQLPVDVPVVALLPGSRNGEVSKLADTFVQTARIIAEHRPGVRFLVPLVTRSTRTLFEEAIFRNEARDLPVTLMFGHAEQAMVAADVVLVASGTATLETALLKRPMVIAYKMARLTYWIAKRLVRAPYIGLPNVLGGAALVPEFIQNAATPEALASAVEHWLDDAQACDTLVERFTDIHLTLRQNHADKAAQAVLQLLGRA
ncbi:lipid-A-disaccharide synthase [Uliginosibacterium sp. sgz301328]|uniref:lipid-A-disaccharide synthase n=1 Tax=Uliginosibacterium sp. sgz301328 TaxID=3243764 RepID=UPI00359ED457